MKKIIIVTALSDSLINFRGDLIQSMKDKFYKVITISPGPSKEYAKVFQEKKILNIPINFKQNRINVFQDLFSLIKLFKIFKQESPEIILSYTIKPVIWGGLVAKFCKINFYALITGLGYSFHGKSFNNTFWLFGPDGRPGIQKASQREPKNA